MESVHGVGRTEAQGESGVGRPGERVAGGVRAEAPAHDEDEAAVMRVRRDGDGDGVAQDGAEHLELSTWSVDGSTLPGPYTMSCNAKEYGYMHAVKTYVSFFGCACVRADRDNSVRCSTLQ